MLVIRNKVSFEEKLKAEENLFNIFFITSFYNMLSKQICREHTRLGWHCMAWRQKTSFRKIVTKALILGASKLNSKLPIIQLIHKVQICKGQTRWWNNTIFVFKQTRMIFYHDYTFNLNLNQHMTNKYWLTSSMHFEHQCGIPILMVIFTMFFLYFTNFRRLRPSLWMQFQNCNTC